MTTPSAGFGLADDPVVQAKNKIMETGAAVTRQARELADILETCSAGWTGVGALGFKQAQSRLNDDHDTIRRLLGVLLHAVGETKNLSNANDDDVRRAFASARSSGSDSGANSSPRSGNSALNGL